MQLKELLKKTDAAQALSIHGNADIDITGIKTDSRQIKKNDLFIAVKGTQTDGHDYIPQAIDKGATVIAYQDMILISKTESHIFVSKTQKRRPAGSPPCFTVTPHQKCSLWE